MQLYAKLGGPLGTVPVQLKADDTFGTVRAALARAAAGRLSAADLVSL